MKIMKAIINQIQYIFDALGGPSNPFLLLSHTDDGLNWTLTPTRALGARGPWGPWSSCGKKPTSANGGKSSILSVAIFDNGFSKMVLQDPLRVSGLR